jgi:hypothetical protein
VADARQFQPAAQAMLAEVQRLQERLIPPAELRKAVKQFVAGTLATRKTMQGQAQDLGANWLAAGDLHFSDHYLDSVRALRPAQLRKVARQYLTRDNLTLYALLPKGTAPRRQHATASRTDHPYSSSPPPTDSASWSNPTHASRSSSSAPSSRAVSSPKTSKTMASAS